MRSRTGAPHVPVVYMALKTFAENRSFSQANKARRPPNGDGRRHPPSLHRSRQSYDEGVPQERLQRREAVNPHKPSSPSAVLQKPDHSKRASRKLHWLIRVDVRRDASKREHRHIRTGTRRNANHQLLRIQNTRILVSGAHTPSEAPAEKDGAMSLKLRQACARSVNTFTPCKKTRFQIRRSVDKVTDEAKALNPNIRCNRNPHHCNWQQGMSSRIGLSSK